MFAQIGKLQTAPKLSVSERMKKTLKYIIASIVLTIFTSLLGVYFWYNYLEYYWHTETLQIYQKEGFIRLCNGENSINPSWNVSAENKLLLAQAENFVKLGLPITIHGRGAISESNSEVFVDKISKIENGVNPDCELKP